MKKSILIAIIMLLGIVVKARQYPEVGKPCPNFVLKGLEYYKKKEMSLDDLKGQWVILDFWNLYCSSCIKSFPHLKELQRQFKNKVQIFSVAWIDRPNTLTLTRDLFERLRKSQGIDLPITYDTTLADEWGIDYLPYIIVIDPQGMVRALALTLNAQQLTDIIAGKTNVAYRKVVTTKTVQQGIDTAYKYDDHKPLFVDGNGGPDSAFLFRSILSKWNPKMPVLGNYAPILIIGNSFKVSPVSIEDLYNYAYINKPFYPDQYQDTATFGKIFAKVIFETSDTALIKTNKITPENYYVYSVTMPKDKISVSAVQATMQRDLENWFGYQVEIEERMMPCYELTANDEAKEKLKTKGETPAWNKDIDKNDVTAYNMINHPVKKFIIGGIISYLPGSNRLFPVFDETGITTNIDIPTMHVTFFNELSEELHKIGLDLKESKRKMKVVVVKDKAIHK